MTKTSVQTKINIYLKVISLCLLMLFVTISFVYAGSGGGGGGGGGGGSTPKAQVGTHAVTNDRNLANQVARDMNSRPNSMCNGCSATVTTNRDGTVSVSVRQNDSGGDSSTGGRPGTPSPTPTCAAQPNLRTIDIFFVPAGTQPARTTASNQHAFSIVRQLVSANPFQRAIIPRNELEVGVLYDPIAMIRNVSSCTSYTNNGGSDNDDTPQLDPRKTTSLFVKTAHAGGNRASAQPNDYPNFVRNQLPFGTGGSFPVRARIDVGDNTTYEWEHYINAFGPIGAGQTIYLRLPVFSTTEVGTHRIGIVTDIRQSIDPGHACFASSTPASVGWGCVRETSEADNDRGEIFTTVTSSTSLRLAVDVSDITVRASSTLSEVPFVTINTGAANITDYLYRVTIGATQFASSVRSTNLAPASRETVRAAGSFTVPNTPTALPLTVCARVATSTEVCDTARLIVATPQCSDSRDNDTDGTQDTSDPGCFDDPLDPTTYDPNDDNEGDMATTSPSVSIEFKPVVNPVRYNTGAALEYIINGPAPMTCLVTGGGTNSPVTHTPPRTAGQVTTAPVTSTQQYTLRCTASVGGSTLQFERTTTVDVLPQIQET